MAEAEVKVSRLTDLIARAKSRDQELGADLEREFKVMASRLSFGLNFERHRPEAVELPISPVRPGDKVRVLPPRGSTSRGDQRLWRVSTIDRQAEAADVELLEGESTEVQTVPLDDLVLVADFRDRIYPGLVSTGIVERGGGKPFHTVINGENYHALKALTYTHRGKIDAIYIDPPYNTGARDWKYNNDYVESDDLYRHSKWLAMMERRLLVAKHLLNPADSVLIVTIDEKEYLRLGLLLEQVFPEAQIQMVSSVINPKGATRSTAFGRTDEYLFFVMFGTAAPQALPLDMEWKIVRDQRATRLRWAELLRAGTDPLRSDSPNQFYPVFIRKGSEGPEFHSVGEPIFGTDRSKIEAPSGCVAVWPIRGDGTEGRWQTSATSFRLLIEKGYARLGRWRGEDTAISYLKRGEQAKVESGVFPIIGKRSDGSIEVDASSYVPAFIPGTQWRIASHNAEQGGTNLLKQLLPPQRRFPFPKSLYAVEDALRFFVIDKPNAVVLDFFAGSGTTAHAVMRLNKEDDGRRQCIMVTNNEVSAQEEVGLRRNGLRPGDQEWEQWGICNYFTKPRIQAAITGKTPEGELLEGEYRFNEIFPLAEGLEENAAFFTLTYESRDAVNHNIAFQRIAPLLWLRAGAQGASISDLPGCGWAVADTYGLLTDLDQVGKFVDVLASASQLRTVFIVTDDNRRFQSIVRELPEGVEPVRLYESYLSNFSFLNGEDT